VRSPFRAFHSLVLAVLGTLAYKLLLVIPDWARDPQYGVYVVPGVVGVLWLLFTTSRTISDRLLEHLPAVRRLFAGHKHVEGDWPLVVVDRRTGATLYYGFLTIGFVDGQYEVVGHDWFPDGRHALDFRSVQTYQVHPTLHYWYQQGERGQQRGYTFMEFFPRDAAPTRHTGEFHDREHPDVRFYARKLKTKMFGPRPHTMEERRRAAKAFADEIAPRLPNMLTRAVDVDWE
jgi:hypothetical protein